MESRKSKDMDGKKKKQSSINSMRHSDAASSEPAFLKYLLDFGGCQLCFMQRRSVAMVNNSDKVYRFIWQEVENLVVKPAVGYISPGEEKDLEIMFFCAQPILIKKVKHKFFAGLLMRILINLQ